VSEQEKNKYVAEGTGGHPFEDFANGGARRGKNPRVIDPTLHVDRSSSRETEKKRRHQADMGLQILLGSENGKDLYDSDLGTQKIGVSGEKRSNRYKNSRWKRGR